MKVNLKPVFAVYGPVGHPGASVHDLGPDPEELYAAFYRHLTKYCAQGFIPTMFFSEHLALEKQGYHVLEVVNGEIDDALIASLPVPRCYQPAAPGEPGRKFAELKPFLPSYNSVDDVEVWNEGTLPEGATAPCDHDFGLESYTVAFRHESGQIFSEQDSFNFKEGEYFNHMTCTRCGAVHAMNQKH